MRPFKYAAEGYWKSGWACLFRLSTAPAYASTILCISCGQTLSLIHVEEQATRPSVSNWLEYRRYLTSDSASSGSLEMSDRMKTRGFEGKDCSLDESVAMLESVL